MSTFAPLIFIFFFVHIFDNVYGQSCGCPAIKTIDKAGLAKLPESKYLASREIFKPSFKVSSICKITVDCSSMKFNDFYFMIFRKGAPPIFNKRFVKTSKKATPFSPAGISCVKVNGVYEWQFYGGKVTDMAFAMQATECGCLVPGYAGAGSPGGYIPNAYGACDIYKPTCRPKFIPRLIAQTASIGVPQTATMTFTDLTCINGTQWYFNNLLVNMNIVLVQCSLSETISHNSVQILKYPCGCREIEMLPVTADDSALRTLWDLYSTKAYEKLSYRKGIAIYNEEKCTANLACTGSDTLVMFSGANVPVKYPDGTTPFMSCNPTPSHPFPDNTYNTKKRWFMDGIMLNVPVFSCIAGNGCACKYVPLNSTNMERLVGSSSFYPLIMNRPVKTPTDDRKGTMCPTKMTCTANYTLVVFDLSTASVFPNGSINATCTTKTRKWTVDSRKDIPDLDLIYAICVDFR